MSKVVRRLGRGLDSLVSNLRTDLPAPDPAPSGPPPTLLAPKPATTHDVARAMDVTIKTRPAVAPTSLPADSLVPNPFQPRGHISEADVLSLAKSIQRNGILQPIPVRRVGTEYQIIAGERRWTAARQIGLAEVPVVVREATDEQMLELALIENLHREDLNAIDRAKAYRNFCGRFNLKPDELAERLGEDRSTVTNYLRLLELPSDIRDMLAAGRLGMGHARCLLSVPSEAKQRALAESIVQNELSVRAVEEITRRGKLSPDSANYMSLSPVPPKRLAAPHITDMQRRFEEALKTKVRIQEGKRKGSGRLIIEYFSLDDFDRIAERMGVSLDR